MAPGHTTRPHPRPPAASPPERHYAGAVPPAADRSKVRLHVVTGKGGTGKTIQSLVAQHLESFQQFPPRQRPGSFSVEQAMEKLRNPPSSN